MGLPLKSCLLQELYRRHGILMWTKSKCAALNGVRGYPSDKKTEVFSALWSE